MFSKPCLRSPYFFYGLSLEKVRSPRKRGPSRASQARGFKIAERFEAGFGKAVPPRLTDCPPR